jgi:hypothetical protein
MVARVVVGMKLAEVTGGVHSLKRSLHILHSRSANTAPFPLEDSKRVYLEKRLGEQLANYARQEGRTLPLFRRLKTGFRAPTILALACPAYQATAATFQAEVPAWMHTTVFYFLPITLPVVAAALISFISINDLQRRGARCRVMQLMLERSRTQITHCQTWNSLERIVLRTGRSLLNEVLEWHSITSFSKSH